MRYSATFEKPARKRTTFWSSVIECTHAANRSSTAFGQRRREDVGRPNGFWESLAITLLERGPQG